MKNFKQETQTNHFLPPDKQSAQITTTNLNFNNSHYKAENQSVISGAQGTHVQGNVVTDSNDGKKVTENSSHKYNVVVPHMTQETKDQFAKNAKWASSFFKPTEDNGPKTTTYYHHGKSYSYSDHRTEDELFFNFIFILLLATKI